MTMEKSVNSKLCVKCEKCGAVTETSVKYESYLTDEVWDAILTELREKGWACYPMFCFYICPKCDKNKGKGDGGKQRQDNQSNT